MILIYILCQAKCLILLQKKILRTWVLARGHRRPGVGTRKGVMPHRENPYVSHCDIRFHIMICTKSVHNLSEHTLT